MQFKEKRLKYILKTLSWSQHSFCNTPRVLLEELGWLWKCSGKTWSSVQADFTHYLLAAGLCCMQQSMWALLMAKSGCSSLLAVRNGQGWSMCLNTLYLCSTYRKIYSSFFCSISWWWWLIVSFVLPSLSSVFLPMGFFYVYPLAGWSCHSASKEKYWPIWSWSSCAGRSYRGLFMFVLVVWWNAPAFLVLR